MRHSRWWLGLTLATVLTGALSRASRAADPVTKFQYAPEEKTRLLNTKTTQTLEAQGVAPQTRTSTALEQQVVKRTEQGYQVLDTVLDGTTSDTRLRWGRPGS